MPKRSRLDETNKDLFKREWVRGTPAKIMAERFGYTASGVRNMAMKWGCQKRRCRGLPRKAITIRVFEDEWLMIKKNAHRSQLPITTYLLNLVKRDG